MGKWTLWRMQPFLEGVSPAVRTRKQNAGHLHNLSHEKESPGRDRGKIYLFTIPFPPLISLFTLTSDVSNMGWGAYCLSGITEDRWDCHKIVSNILNLCRASCTLQAFYHMTGSLGALKLVNSMVVPYIKRQWGTHSLFSITGSGVNHVLGQVESSQSLCGLCSWNLEYSNRFSFLLDTKEWSLHVKDFRRILSLGVSPEVDPFASTCNNKLEKYYMWGWYFQAFESEAHSDHWKCSRTSHP